MFRKLGRRFRSLLTRDYNLEEQLAQAAQQGTSFSLSSSAFFDLLEPANGLLEESKTAALGEDWKEAGLALLEHFQERTRPHGLLQPADHAPLVQLLKGHPQDCRRWVRAGEAALQRRFSPMLADEISFPHSIDWYSDFSGGSWMMGSEELLRQQFKLQPLGLEQQEALLRTWSFNELGHLVDLTRSFWLTGNEAFASEAIVQAVDWGERNPVFFGVNWYYPRSVAHRALNWYLFLQPVMTSHLMQGDLLLRLLRSLLIHQGYLALHLKGDAQYRLACAASLYLLSSHLPEFVPAKRWQTLARQHLQIAIQEDFDSDGFHQSSNLSLHREALDWLLLCYLFDQLNSRQIDGLQGACEKALEALLYLRPPQGQQGESGAALIEGILGRQAGPAEYALRQLWLGGVLLQRGDLHPAPTEVPAEMLWWAGTQTTEAAQELKRIEPRGIRRLFGAAQVASVRDQWGPRSNWCQLKGYLGRWSEEGNGTYCHPHPIQLPQHDDALSFTLNLEGEPVFLEPGGPIAGGELGRLFGRLASHSAVRIGRELEPLQVAPDVEPPAGRLKLESCRDGHYLACQRPCWFDLQEPFWLTREVLFLPKKQRVLLRDTLEGEGEVHFECNLLLAPHLDILMRGDMGSLLRGKKLQARILPLFPSRFRYEVVKGRSQDLQGFFWSEGGRAVPTNLLRYYARVQLPATVSLWIAWNPEDTLTPRPQDVEKMFRGR